MEIVVQAGHIEENLIALKNRYNKDIFLVVKNNAYNLGLMHVVQTAMRAGVTHFIVTDIESALQIRASHKDAYVLVMRALGIEEIELCKMHKLATIIPSFEWYQHFQADLSGIDLHLKVNVGMNRFGISELSEYELILKHAQTNGYQLVGMCTHFPLADEADLTIHQEQVQFFAELYFTFIKQGHVFQYVHAENSATLMQEDCTLVFCNFSRIGILAYGYSPTTEQNWLKPALYCYATVLQIQTLLAGEHLGYGTVYKAEKAQKIAILDIGYGDGLIRRRKELPAYINGKAYPFAGNISMSHAYLIVDEDVNVGDKVEIFGTYTPIDHMMRSLSGVANSEILAYLHINKE